MRAQPVGAIRHILSAGARSITRSAPKAIATASAVGALFLATPLRAQALQDGFWVELSGFWANVDTDLTVASVANPVVATQIDLEDDLGLDENEFLPAFVAGARLGSGFSIIGEYYSLGREGPFTLARDVTIEDVTYPASVNVTSGFNTDIYRLVVGWAFLRNENFEAGAALGLHATDIEFSVTGEGSIGGATRQIQTRRAEFLAPLPTIGLFATYEPMPGLTLGARIDFLSLSIGDYDGRLINMQATAAYRFTRNFGIGVGYRFVDYRVDVEKEAYTGRFAYEFSGPMVFLTAGF